MPEEFSNLTDEADLYEVALAFDQALDAAPQDHALLTRWTARFPQFAEELMDVGYARFAFGLTLTDPVTEYSVESAPDNLPISAADRAPLTNLMEEAKARGLDAAEFARILRLDKLLLGKLNRRNLDALTLPWTLVERLALTLERSFDEVTAYLSGGMRLASQAHYKARQAPSIVAEAGAPKQSFAEALQSGAQLPDEDTAFWLAEIASGRTLGNEHETQ